jgi:hypothetical protein
MFDTPKRIAAHKSVDNPCIIWDKTEIADVDVGITILGILKVKVKVVYAYDETSVMSATAVAN